ncbi:hypothetical protein HYH02_014621 [Chlamydomonas schloesseri]|uniref:Transmembrane protein 138 n=1 Tax=Chlamydomonas schloesseri TaxID=2026947 RepID=A0A835SKH6_9CHLO|nr:hypothetical protein HYH02_014621 [Chlamydomonas schloesseri]|eukprot:KAG2427216.1 hypothetical protein HYH02_014621 [Chlamydomonas schloesseri]
MPNTIFKLASAGKHSSKVHAWTNPAFEDKSAASPGKPADAQITVMPSGEAELTEVMFPSYKKMLRRMSYQALALYALIVGHVMLTAYTDPMYTRTPLTQVIVYTAQIGLLVAIIMAFFVLTSQTLYIQLGRYDLYLSQFAFLYGLFVLDLCLYVAIKVYATVLLYQRVNHIAMWYAPGYTALWTVQRLVLLLFWVAAAYSCYSVFDPRFFDPEYIVGLERREEEEARGVSHSKARR